MMSKNDNFSELQAAYTAQLSPRYATSTSAQNAQGAVGQSAANCYSEYTTGWGNYPNYYPYTQSYQTVYVDKTQKAFSIAKKLMDKDLVQCDTVKQFITLIDLLVGTL